MTPDVTNSTTHDGVSKGGTLFQLQRNGTGLMEALHLLSASQDEVLSVLGKVAADVKETCRSHDQLLLAVNTIASDVKGLVNVRSLGLPLLNRTRCTSESTVRQQSEDDGDYLDEEPERIDSGRSPLCSMRRSHSPPMSPLGTTSSRLSVDRRDQWPASIQIRENYVLLDDDGGLDANELCDMPTIIESNNRRAQAASRLSRWRWISDPDSFHVFVLDVTMAIALVNDLVISPYALAWRVDDAMGFFIPSTICSCYWLLDFVCNFFVGYYEKGVLVWSLRKIALRYLKTWLCVDMIVLIVDWTFIFLREDSNAPRGFGKLLRAFKMVKLIRLLRVVKIQKILGNSAIAMWTLNMNQTVDQAFRVAKVLTIILFLNHLLSCLWFVIGVDAPSDTRKSWIQQPRLELIESGNFDFSPDEYQKSEATLLFQYVCTLHQITAHIALASCNIYPNNSIEGIVAIILLIYGLLFGGTLVSYFSTTLTQRALASYEKNKQLDTLREYIQQRCLRPPLALLMYKAARDRLDKSVQLTEDDVPAISLLPHDLHVWLYRETRLQYLISYPLFSQWKSFNMELTQLLCQKVATFIFLTSGDVVFVATEVAKSAYHIVRGSLKYVNGGKFRPEERSARVTTEVEPGAWVAEAALWAHWSHVGRLMVTDEDSSLLVVDAQKLPDIANKDVKIAGMTTQWAQQFHLRLISAEPPLADWPDDLTVPDTASSDLMSKEVGLGLLRRHRKKGLLHITEEAFVELEEEVESGKSAIQSDAYGNLERIVAVMAVRLERNDGYIFAEIGSWEDGCGKPGSVRLPATKRSAGELQHVAMRRVLDNTLMHFDGRLEFDRIERSTFFKESKVGLLTKYLRTTRVVKIKDSSCPALPKAHDRSNSHPAAFLLPDCNGRDKLKIFSWVTPDMMTYFNDTGHGADELAKWVSHLSSSLYRDV